MRKILTSLLLAGLTAVPLRAAETASHDNRLYFVVGESDDISKIPISLHLENPSISITAIEMYLTFPEQVTIVSNELATRAIGTHTITEGDTQRGYFVSVASEGVKNFSDIDGVVCTILCDFSSLNDGDYSVTASGIFAVGVNNNEVTSYITDDQCKTITKDNNIVTGIEKATPNTIQGTLEIYNIQGIRLNEPQKGQINIINGKKVIL